MCQRRACSSSLVHNGEHLCSQLLKTVTKSGNGSILGPQPGVRVLHHSQWSLPLQLCHCKRSVEAGAV